VMFSSVVAGYRAF